MTATPGPSSPDTHGPAAAPARMSPALLVGGTIGVMVTCAIVCAAIAGLLNREPIWRGSLAGATAGSIATLLSLVPILLVLNRNFHTLMAGYMIGSAARAIVTFGIALLAIKVGDYPKWETLAFTGAFYFSLLAAEAAILSRMTWTTPLPTH